MRSLRRMTAGLGRAVAWPRLVAVTWLANLLVALPAAVMLGDRLRRSVGKSEAGERLLEGFDFSWHGEFMSDAEGLERTFEPGRLVTGGWLENLDGWWSGRLFEQPAAILAFGGLFTLVWILLSAGVVAHYHRPPQRFRLAEFLADGGGFFFRFLRLSLISAPIYYGIFRLARWLFPSIEDAMRDVTAERTVLVYNLLAALVIVVLIATVKMGFDYARIAMVVEERRSSLLAALRGLGFVVRRPLVTWGLLLSFALLGLVLLALRLWLVPGVGQQSILAILAVFLLGQAFLLARLGLRLGLLAAELALYEDETP